MDDMMFLKSLVWLAQELVALDLTPTFWQAALRSNSPPEALFTTRELHYWHLNAPLPEKKRPERIRMVREIEARNQPMKPPLWIPFKWPGKSVAFFRFYRPNVGVLVIRGSYHLKDWVQTDVDIRPASAATAGVERGYDVMKAKIRALYNKHAREVRMLFLGHSLGGALAAVAARDIVTTFPTLPAPILVTFGSPALFTRDFQVALAPPHLRGAAQFAIPTDPFYLVVPLLHHAVAKSYMMESESVQLVPAETPLEIYGASVLSGSGGSKVNSTHHSLYTKYVDGYKAGDVSVSLPPIVRWCDIETTF